MDWNFESRGAVSDHSGEPFKPGDRVLNVLLRMEDGTLARRCILESERTDFADNGAILGWWVAEVPPAEEKPAETAKRNLQRAEDFFVSLFDQEGGESVEDGDTLKVLLALLLERKRQLKPAQVPDSEMESKLPGRWLKMSAQDRTFFVPDAEVSPESLARVQEVLGLLTGGRGPKADSGELEKPGA